MDELLVLTELLPLLVKQIEGLPLLHHDDVVATLFWSYTSKHTTLQRLCKNICPQAPKLAGGG